MRPHAVPDRPHLFEPLGELGRGSPGSKRQSQVPPEFHEFRFGQFWQPTLSAGFQPGRVRVVKRGKLLEVEAHLTDRHIKDGPASFNEPVYTKGDVIEIFVMAEGDESYHEFHVTPSNSILQLRFRCGKRPQSQKDVDDAMIWERLGGFSTERLNDGWVARFSCPLSKLTQMAPVPTRWKLACGRYDYSADGQSRIISNTAPLTAPDFHRSWEWPVMDLD